MHLTICRNARCLELDIDLAVTLPCSAASRRAKWRRLNFWTIRRCLIPLDAPESARQGDLIAHPTLIAMGRGSAGCAHDSVELIQRTFEMLPQPFINLLDRCLGRWHVPERIQQHEVVNGPVVTNRCHVAADGVAGDGNTASVSTKLTGVRGHPLQRGVAFFQLSWKLCKRQRRVLHEHTDLPRPDDQVAQQALMVLEIADDPDTAVIE